MRRFLPFLCLLCFFSPVFATDDYEALLTVDATQFPSYALVTETELPPLDRFDLAQRLQGVSDISMLNLTDGIREIGEIEIFRISSVEGGGIASVPMRLVAIGEHIYFWVEDGIPVDETHINTFVSRFDSEVYDYVRNLWGNESSPGIDGETRIHIVITQRLLSHLGGYFSAGNTYPASIVPASNERDMMVLDSIILLPQYLDYGIGTAAHEFTHLIQYGIDLNESSWMDEGFASFTEFAAGFGQSGDLLDAFARYPETSLTMWNQGSNRFADYGASLLFIIYLHDRFGRDAIQEIANNSDNGLGSIDTMLNARNEAPADVIFADWVLANLLRDTEGDYSYQSTIDSEPVNFEASVLNFPSIFSRDLHQYATHYYQYQNLGESVTISLDMLDTINLIALNDSTINHFMYSLRGDNSNTRLSRAFDLRELESAQLDFDIFYELENEWDYVYISISADNGETWNLQATNYTTTANSNGRAYGAAYTGLSNAWLSDSLSLDAYAGQEILIRFEMVTDDSTNFSGFALDNVRLSEIGYDADFENDDGGWLSDGWIRTDNRLPQRMWVQIIEQGATERVIHRFLAQGNQQWQLDLTDSTDSLIIALSPFAPMTTEAVSYTLQVE